MSEIVESEPRQPYELARIAWNFFRLGHYFVSSAFTLTGVAEDCFQICKRNAPSPCPLRQAKGKLRNFAQIPPHLAAFLPSWVGASRGDAKMSNYYHLPVPDRGLWAENLCFSMKVERTLRGQLEQPSKIPSKKKTAPRCAVYLMYLALSVRFALLSDAQAATTSLDVASFLDNNLTDNIAADVAHMERVTQSGVTFFQGLVRSLSQSIKF